VDTLFSFRTVSSTRLCSVAVLIAVGSLLGACGYRPLTPYNTQLDLPEAIRVPPGHQVAVEARSSGTLTYECQAVKRQPFEYAWLLRNSSVDLTDTYGNNIVHTPGPRPRAGWVHRDGSRTAVVDFVEVPNGNFSLPLQRTKAEPSPAPGTLHNVSYVQRVRTLGGLASVKPCSAPELGMRMGVPYEADYVFWRPA
jgi:hypothetical protein